MRILITSNWFPPVTSGSAYYASSLAQTLAARGNDVLVVTLDWGPGHELSEDMPFRVEHLPVLKIPKLSIFYNLDLMGFAFTPGNRRRLTALCREFRPDVVHHVNHIFDTMFLSLSAARAVGVPVVGSITTPIQHQSPFHQALMHFADRWTVGRFGVQRWDGIVSLDQIVHSYVGRVYGERAQARSVVIPFGVPLESMKLFEDVPLERPRPPQILQVGHIHPFRNPVQLVRAMPLILEAVPDARLVLAGRVDLNEPVEAARKLGLKEDKVHFLGQTPHDEVVRLLKTSHCFVTWGTGPYPALGTAGAEAMLCQTPVVNDMPEDLFGAGKLENGTNIVLVDSRNLESIANGIVSLLQDEEARRRIGAASRRFVLDVMDWDRIAERIEELYERVGSHPRHAN
jgi:glycosyltransferase involved in cell wall biosynthesis